MKIPARRIRLPHPEDGAGSFRKSAQFWNEVRHGRLPRDLLVTTLVWVAAFAVLHLNLSSICVCYAAFGFSWASQQFTYQVRTLRHAVLGTDDLNLWEPLELLYLHFNYHPTHPIAVWVPRNYLALKAAQPPTRGYASAYIKLWRLTSSPMELPW
jgi:hypothetical protein